MFATQWLQSAFLTVCVEFFTFIIPWSKRILVNCSPLTQAACRTSSPLAVQGRCTCGHSRHSMYFLWKKNRPRDWEADSAGVSSVIWFVGKHHRLSYKLQRWNELLSTRMRTSEADIPLDSKVLQVQNLSITVFISLSGVMANCQRA